jgi:hypothetical protein
LGWPKWSTTLATIACELGDGDELSRQPSNQRAGRAVWEILTDSSKYGDWNRAVVSIEGTIGPGNTISLVSIVNPKRTFKLHITEAIPDMTESFNLFADSLKRAAEATPAA